MRHQRNTTKLKRTASHRDAMLANLACSLIEHERVTTTLAKAKALRPFAEKLVTLGKKGTLHARRLAIARLRQNAHWKMLKSGKRIDHVAKLFGQIAPAAQGRSGGYTRILKLQTRVSDAAPMALIEWVDRPGETVAVEVAEPAAETKPKATKAATAAAATAAAPAAVAPTAAAPEPDTDDVEGTADADEGTGDPVEVEAKAEDAEDTGKKAE